jgi:hypothetical protein
MPTRNGQFEYPDVGWSTGTMRKVGDDIGAAAGAFADSPVVESMERMLKGQKQAQGQFDTVLSPAEEIEFQKWKKKHAPNDSGVDYDLRGAFKAGIQPDRDTGHWPDLYKKPNHPTFSDQSIYAKDRPDLAGRWEGDKYIPPRRKTSQAGGLMQMAKAKGDPERSSGVAQDWLGEAYSRRGGRETMVY